MDALHIAFFSGSNYKKIGYPVKPDQNTFFKHKDNSEVFDVDGKLLSKMYLKGRLFCSINYVVLDKDHLTNKDDLIYLKEILEKKYKLDTSTTILEIDFDYSLNGPIYYLKDYIENYDKIQNNELLYQINR